MLDLKGSKTSLKKDILSMQKKMKKFDESEVEKYSKDIGKIKADKALKDLNKSDEETLENNKKRGTLKLNLQFFCYG